MIRRFFVWLHRWVGLALALFLIIEGATGSLLAFYTDLTTLLDPSSFAPRPSPQARPLDPATLAERADAIRPHAKFAYFESVNDEQVIVLIDSAHRSRNRQALRHSVTDFIRARSMDGQ